MEITKWPPFFRKLCALRATILVWSGWATSAKMTSTIPWRKQQCFNKQPCNKHSLLFKCSHYRNLPTSMRYLCGCRASSMMGIMLVLFLATFSKSLPDLWENSTAYTNPSCEEKINQLIQFQKRLPEILSNSVMSASHTNNAKLLEYTLLQSWKYLNI